ncbi:hypothetical protein Efla_001091 [Eimeria flavescens]
MGLTSCVLLFAAGAKVLCLLVVAAVARVVYSRCAGVQHASIGWGVGSGCRQVDGRRGVAFHRTGSDGWNLRQMSNAALSSSQQVGLQELPPSFSCKSSQVVQVIQRFIVGTGVALAVGDSEQLLESAEVHGGNASLCRRRQRRQRRYGTAYDWVTAGSSGFAYANLAKMAAFLATAVRAVAALRWTVGIEMCCMSRVALDVGTCMEELL